MPDLPPDEYDKPWKQRGQKVSDEYRGALVAYFEGLRGNRDKHGWAKKVADKHQVKYTTLKQMIYRCNHGLIDLTPRDDDRMMVEAAHSSAGRTIELCLNTEDYLTTLAEEIMREVRAPENDGNRTIYFDLGMPDILKALKEGNSLRAGKEAVIKAALDNMRAMRAAKRELKNVDGKVVEQPSEERIEAVHQQWSLKDLPDHNQPPPIDV